MMNERDVTAAVARELRAKSGLAQTAFWAAVGVQQSVGCRYESGATKIPKPVRMLLVATYVSPAGTALDNIKSVRATARQARKQLLAATDKINEACEALGLAAGEQS